MEVHYKKGLSLPQMVEEGTLHLFNHKRQPKKFWGLFGEVAHIAQESL